MVPDTWMLRAGAACPAWVENSSTYTGAAIPDANAVPLPTRTTARLNASNGVSVGVGVDVETGVTVAVDEPEGVTVAVTELDGVAVRVAELDSVGTADREGGAVLVAVLVTVARGVPVIDGVDPNEIEADPV